MTKLTQPAVVSTWKLKNAIACFCFLASLLVTNILLAQSARLDQWQKIDQKWEYGNLNRKHSSYVEDESVPYRIFMSGLTANTQRSITFSFDITATNGNPVVKHGIDYLTSFNRTIGNPPFDDPTIQGDVPSGFTFPSGSPSSLPIPAPSNLSFLAGLSQGNMIMYGGTVDNVAYADEGDPTSAHSSAQVTVTFTPSGSDAVLLFGGHLAKDGDYPNTDDGAGGIHGSPYHMSLVSFDQGQNIGSQNRSVQVGYPTCTLPNDCFDDLYQCATPGLNTAQFDLTTSKCGAASWFTDADFTQAIADAQHFVASDNTIVYGIISNDCGNATAYVTLHVNPLPVFGTITTNPTCSGSSNGSIAIACTSGISYHLQNCDGTNAGSTQNCTGANVTWTGLSGGCYKIVATNNSTQCTNTSSTITIAVNPLPVIGATGSTPTCSGTSNGTISLATCESGVTYQLQTSGGTNVGTTKSCAGTALTWTALAAGDYKVVATNTITGCSNTSSTITVIAAICDATLTQGFYGQQTGKDCKNKTALQIMQAALGGQNKTFGSGQRSFTLKTTDVVANGNIFKMLPGGSTPAALGMVPNSGSGSSACLTSNASLNGGLGTATYDCSASWSYVPISSKGGIGNILLSQTMALFFNTKNSSTLKNIILTGNVLTFDNLNCGSSTPGSYASTQTIPCSVFSYLSNPANYPSGATINNLLDLANKVLGGTVTTISASDMTKALDAINTGFDKGKALVNQSLNCASGPITSKDQLQLKALPVPVVSVYPNPYSTKVNFVITANAAGKVSLQVFNVLGQNVKTIFEGYLQAGQTQTVNFDVPPTMQSMLIYQLKMGDQQITGKVLQSKN